jgi:hypothetical protein
MTSPYLLLPLRTIEEAIRDIAKRRTVSQQPGSRNEAAGRASAAREAAHSLAPEEHPRPEPCSF